MKESLAGDVKRIRRIIVLIVASYTRVPLNKSLIVGVN